MALSTDDKFNLEVLKLLLHVAWVDGAVDQTEANMLLGLGRSWSVPEVALQKLMEAVKSGRRPSDPNCASGSRHTSVTIRSTPYTASHTPATTPGFRGSRHTHHTTTPSTSPSATAW